MWRILEWRLLGGSRWWNILGCWAAARGGGYWGGGCWLTAGGGGRFCIAVAGVLMVFPERET